MAAPGDAVANANESVMQDLQKQLAVAKISVPELSTLAQKGNEKLVEKFLSESVEVQGGSENIRQSQLYIAAFWGFPDVVKTLLEAGADVNYQNKDTLWTPLHAAAFQEHGKIIMILLENDAKPEIPDKEERTAKDFASASDKIWSHFAILGCKRTSKIELIEKGIIKKVTAPPSRNTPSPSSMAGGIRMAASFSRPGSAYAIRPDPFVRAKKNPNDSSQMLAALGGDVLADEKPPDASGKPQVQDPSFSVWRN
ncbi:ankyrin-1-like [Acanthaster planci]|uniref:Ankyrin-1-like n=1 Tax=Acanthaster planci TaxID=133434 RepID=A0A8B7YU15_ACAPL|nr:ankyrin-1-like [Acanthaster planci]